MESCFSSPKSEQGESACCVGIKVSLQFAHKSYLNHLAHAGTLCYFLFDEHMVVVACVSCRTAKKEFAIWTWSVQIIQNNFDITRVISHGSYLPAFCTGLWSTWRWAHTSLCFFSSLELTKWSCRWLLCFRTILYSKFILLDGEKGEVRRRRMSCVKTLAEVCCDLFLVFIATREQNNTEFWTFITDNTEPWYLPDFSSNEIEHAPGRGVSRLPSMSHR